MTSIEENENMIQVIEDVEQQFDKKLIQEIPLSELQINRVRRKYSQPKINKSKTFKPLKYWYTKASPPDLQFEERNQFQVAQYDGESIYERNIDKKLIMKY